MEKENSLDLEFLDVSLNIAEIKKPRLVLINSGAEILKEFSLEEVFHEIADTYPMPNQLEFGKFLQEWAEIFTTQSHQQ